MSNPQPGTEQVMPDQDCARIGRDLAIKISEMNRARIAKLEAFVLKVRNHGCFGGSVAHNEPCTLNADPDPEVYCLGCLAADILATDGEG
jgi:hypothetical protein